MTTAPGNVTTQDLPRRMPTTFNGLHRLHPLRPIRDDDERDQAVRILARLSGREDRTRDQSDYLETLTDLINKYEDAEDVDLDCLTEGADDDWPVHERIAHLLDMADMTASDLGELLGNRSLGSKLVRGEREPSKTHIRILADRFKVSPAFFL